MLLVIYFCTSKHHHEIYQPGCYSMKKEKTITLQNLCKMGFRKFENLLPIVPNPIEFGGITHDNQWINNVTYWNIWCERLFPLNVVLKYLFTPVIMECEDWWLHFDGLQFGTTPLVWACRKGYVECVRHLLSHGASVDVSGIVSTWTVSLLQTV